MPPVQSVHSSARQPSPAKLQVEAIVEQKKDGQSLPTDQNVVQKATADNSRGFVVRLKVNQSGILKVTIDGSISQDYALVVGDSIEWKAERTILLELSNAGGVEAEINGRPLKSFGQTGKPATVVLGPDGINQ